MEHKCLVTGEIMSLVLTARKNLKMISLRSHVRQAKGTKCSRIHETSTLPANLEKRQNILAKELPCKYCGKRYGSQDSMDRHVRGVHKKLKQ